MTTGTGNADSTPGDVPLDPLAICTLPPEGLGDRLTWIRAEILPHAVARESAGDTIAWELDDVPGRAASLERLVALEKDCCSAITFVHRPSTTAGQRRFEVRGIDPGAHVFTDSATESGERTGIGVGIAKAAGVGTLFGLLVCCAFPVAMAAIWGAAVAAPFAVLDDPWIVAGVAGVAGCAAYVWQRQRNRTGPVAGD
jgi:hypothetical protein